MNTLFRTNSGNNSLSISTLRYWSSRGGAETIHKLQKIIELRPQNDIDLHVEEVRKEGNQIKIGDKECKVSDLDTHKDEINDELKNVENSDLEDMVFWMELTYNEIEKILDAKYIPSSSIRYTLPPGVYEIIDITLRLKSLLPDDVKVNITNEDARLKSNLTTNKTIRFTKKTSFLYKIRFYSIPSRRIRWYWKFFQLIPGT